MKAQPALSKKRFGGGGLLLIPLLLVLLVVPLCRHRGLDHPLAGVETLDLCHRLPVPPLPREDLTAAPGPQPADSRCTYSYAREPQPALSVVFSSTRQYSAGGAAVDTGKMFETWMAETRVSHGNSSDVPGPWKHGGAWVAGKRQSLLFEDGGIMVVLESDRLDAERLRIYAESVQQALRQEKKK